MVRRLPTLRRAGNTAGAAFTLVEMLTVVAIIAMATALAIPFMIGLTRGGKLSQAEDAVHSACLVARSRAISSRRMMCVTLLEAEQQILVNDYETLRNVLPVKEVGVADAGSTTTTLERESGATDNRTGYYVTLVSGIGKGQTRLIASSSGETLTLDEPWTERPADETGTTTWTAPESGDRYYIGGKEYDWVCPHYEDNYAYAGTGPGVRAQKRIEVLTELNTDRVYTLPGGCRFDLDRDGSDPTEQDPPDGMEEPPGWTYIFTPTGAVWTLDTQATNERNNEHWTETTYTEGGEPVGPIIHAPRGGGSSMIKVFAQSGQIITE
mgnify:CR=1 FL=1